MTNGFDVYRKLDSGEELHIAWRPNRKLAERLVHDLIECWPAEYGIHEVPADLVLCAPYNGEHYWLN